MGGGTWRIIPVSKWLVTPIYKPFRPFIRGITPVRGLTITMVINHLRPSWDDPPSSFRGGYLDLRLGPMNICDLCNARSHAGEPPKQYDYTNYTWNTDLWGAFMNGKGAGVLNETNPWGHIGT